MKNHPVVRAAGDRVFDETTGTDRLSAMAAVVVVRLAKSLALSTHLCLRLSVLRSWHHAKLPFCLWPKAHVRWSFRGAQLDCNITGFPRAFVLARGWEAMNLMRAVGPTAGGASEERAAGRTRGVRQAGRALI